MNKHWERGTRSSAQDELLARTGSARGEVGKEGYNLLIFTCQSSNEVCCFFVAWHSRDLTPEKGMLQSRLFLLCTNWGYSEGSPAADIS